MMTAQDRTSTAAAHRHGVPGRVRAVRLDVTDPAGTAGPSRGDLVTRTAR
jgi:hypothetical protein